MAKAGNFDIMKAMSLRNLDIRMAPIPPNLLRAQKTKAGTQITIGFAGDVIAGIAQGKFIGGLILCDAQQYDAIRKELESK